MAGSVIAIFTEKEQKMMPRPDNIPEDVRMRDVSKINVAALQKALRCIARGELGECGGAICDERTCPYFQNEMEYFPVSDTIDRIATDAAAVIDTYASAFAKISG